MSRNSALILILVLLAYALLSVYRPEGLMIYFFPILCWSIVALIILWICGAEKLRLWFSKPATGMALLTAVLQIVALVFVSLFTGFGRSPYAFTPTAIIINVAYFSSALITIELSRAYLIKSCPKRKIFTGIALTALFYAFISFSPARFLAVTAPSDTAKFLGSDFLPALAHSLFATYLALLGGPVASIAYLGTLEAFEWLSPILPNPPWALKALITTLIPVVGFLTVNEVVSPFKLMQLGIISRAEVKSRIRRTKKSSSLSWITIAMISVILVWGSTGLLGFQPSVITSGSMMPALDVGDIVIIVQASPEKIKVGDVIQYWRQGDPAPIVHRVIQIDQAGGTIYIVTKGDANNAPDDPITVTQTIGKVALVIPKLGWISIALKTAIAEAWSFVSANTTLAYATLVAVASAASICVFQKYKKRSYKHWRRR